MTEKKTCYNCGNKNCHIFYATVKQDVAEHHETYEYTEFDCVNHDKWKEMKVEEIRTDNTEPLKNALERIAELEKEYANLKALRKYELNISKLEIEKLESQIKKMKCCGNCIGNCNSDDMIRFCKDNDYKLWEIKENDR